MASDYGLQRILDLQNMFCMGILSVPRAELGLSQFLDYRGVGLGMFHCMYFCVCLSQLDGYIQFYA